MFTVALTGNIASGKSAVVGHFAAWGATVIDADRLVHDAQRPGTATLAAIVRRFGADMLKPDGSLDRDTLRARVMRNDAARASLNAIVHPEVRRRRDELARAAAARGDLILLNDIPLLFEVLDPEAFDFVILVDAPVAQRRRRLAEQRGLPAEEADRLIAAQMPAAPKRDRSDLVIDNAGSLDDLREAAWHAWTQLRARAARGEVPDAAGPLLAVFAHPSDESFAAGGTLARYHDAGIATHLLCLTADGSEDVATRRRDELRRAAAALDLTSHEMLDYPDGRLEADDATGAAAVARVMARVQPAVVLTFGPHGAHGQGDHVAVHRWVQRAVTVGTGPRTVYHVAFPDDPATSPPGARPHASQAIRVQLDVRPWQDVKRAAIAAHGQRHAPVARGARIGWPSLEREWYGVDPPRPGVVFDLYAGRTGSG